MGNHPAEIVEPIGPGVPLQLIPPGAVYQALRPHIAVVHRLYAVLRELLPAAYKACGDVHTPGVGPQVLHAQVVPVLLVPPWSEHLPLVPCQLVLGAELQLRELLPVLIVQPLPAVAGIDRAHKALQVLLIEVGGCDAQVVPGGLIPSVSVPVGTLKVHRILRVCLPVELHPQHGLAGIIPAAHGTKLHRFVAVSLAAPYILGGAYPLPHRRAQILGKLGPFIGVRRRVHIHQPHTEPHPQKQQQRRGPCHRHPGGLIPLLAETPHNALVSRKGRGQQQKHTPEHQKRGKGPARRQYGKAHGQKQQRAGQPEGGPVVPAPDPHPGHGPEEGEEQRHDKACALACNIHLGGAHGIWQAQGWQVIVQLGPIAVQHKVHRAHRPVGRRVKAEDHHQQPRRPPRQRYPPPALAAIRLPPHGEGYADKAHDHQPWGVYRHPKGRDKAPPASKAPKGHKRPIEYRPAKSSVLLQQKPWLVQRKACISVHQRSPLFTA